MKICRTPIDHPSAWRGSDFPSRDGFAIDLDPRHLRAFERAIERIRAEGLGLDDIERCHIYDNRNLLHSGTWYDADAHIRIMWRTTVRGNADPTYAGETHSWVPSEDFRPS